jgi:hypothetical protein
MSTQTVESLTLTQGIVGLLGALYRDTRGYVHVLIGRGSATTAAIIPAGQRFDYVPPVILTELGYAQPADIRLTVATASQDKSWLDLPAVWVEIPLEPAFDNHLGYVIPDEVAAAARDRLAAFPLPPSAVVDQVWTWLALWLLDAPLRLDMPEERARAERLQHALAVAVGGLTADLHIEIPRGTHAFGPAQHETVPGYSPVRPALRLPGSRERSRGVAGHLVQLAHLDADLRYAVAAIEQALESPAATEQTTREHPGREQQP